MADTDRAAFEAWARQAMGLLDSTPLDWELKWVEAAFKSWQARAALASRPAEVDESRKPPRTPEEMVAFIGSHFDAMRDETSDPEDIRFTLSVHDLLSAMSDWFDDYAESAYPNEKAAEVDDEGLPVLPKESANIWYHRGLPNFDDTDALQALDDGTGKAIPLFTAEQYRQGQRDAVAADRARMDWTEISDAITEAYNYAHSIKDWDAAKYWRELREQLDQWAAPSHTTDKENG